MIISVESYRAGYGKEFSKTPGSSREQVIPSKQELLDLLFLDVEGSENFRKECAALLELFSKPDSEYGDYVERLRLTSEDYIILVPSRLVFDPYTGDLHDLVSEVAVNTRRTPRMIMNLLIVGTVCTEIGFFSFSELNQLIGSLVPNNIKVNTSFLRGFLVNAGISKDEAKRLIRSTRRGSYVLATEYFTGKKITLFEDREKNTQIYWNYTLCRFEVIRNGEVTEVHQYPQNGYVWETILQQSGNLSQDGMSMTYEISLEQFVQAVRASQQAVVDYEISNNHRYVTIDSLREGLEEVNSICGFVALELVSTYTKDIGAATGYALRVARS